MLMPMELIFVVRESNDGGFVARAPGHSIVAEAASWTELRQRARESANRHFESAAVHPEQIRLHLVKDELISCYSGEVLIENHPDSWIKEMEPALDTPAELQEVLAELSAREPIFHRPEFGTSRADFERVTVQDYWETGASGRRYSRKAVLDGLEERFSVPHEDVWQTSDLQCRRLGPGTYLLTYTLLQDNQRLTRRATIWQRMADGWKIVYHQGTIVQDA
jgi:hypothetical protein